MRMEARDDTGFASQVSPWRGHGSGRADCRGCIGRQQLAAVPRRAGRAWRLMIRHCRMPGAPRRTSRWKIDVPGRSWSSPVVWGDHVFVTTAINTAGEDALLPVSAYVSRSNGGTMSFADLAKSSAPHRWLLYDIDFKTGKIRWERQVGSGGAAPAAAHEEQLCLRDAGDRRRAGICLFRVRRPVRVRHERQAAVVQADGSPQDAHRPGQRRLARAGRRSRLHRQRQRRAVVHRRLRHRDRRGGVARSIARKPATGRRRSRGRTSGEPRS